MAKQTRISLLSPRGPGPVSSSLTLVTEDVIPQQKKQRVTVSVFGKFAQAFCLCNRLRISPLPLLATAPVTSVTLVLLSCAAAGLLKTMWMKPFALQVCVVLDRPKRNLSPDQQRIRTKIFLASFLFMCSFASSSSMFVCLPPQHDNDDCNGHPLKDGDTQNVSVVQCGLSFFFWMGSWCW